MHSAQINVGRYRALLENPEQMLALCLDQHPGTDQIIFLRFGDDHPADLVFAGLDAHDLIHHMLPGADGNQRVAVAEVNAGQAQVHRRLLAGFVGGDEQPGGLKFISRFKALLDAGGFVFEVESSPVTTDQTECLFH